MTAASNRWPDRRILDLFGLNHPIIQAPMAGASTPELAVAVMQAGAMGSLACALLSVDQAAAALAKIRTGADGPVNVNFFCHTPPAPDAAAEAAWRQRLRPYYTELGLDPSAEALGAVRSPFDKDLCDWVESARPEVVSFQFGLPARVLLDRVRASGARIVGCATTVAEARWLEARGCDAIIAMGFEAGGHQGCFLDLEPARRVGTFALVPQVVDAVSVPVIAAGGVSDARGVAAALTLGASAVQIGTAYLFCPETGLREPHLAALGSAAADETALTNVFTGRPARGVINRLVREIGPMSNVAPAFPLAADGVGPLRAAAQRAGSFDFTSLWCGQAAGLAKPAPAGEFTSRLARDALALLGGQAA